MGLSLAALRAFAEAHAGQEFPVQNGDEGCTTMTTRGAARRGEAVHQLPFSQLTAAQVMDAVVAPATQAHGCSYAELLTKQARERGRRAACARPLNGRAR
jgi:hypothetical protein